MILRLFTLIFIYILIVISPFAQNGNIFVSNVVQQAYAENNIKVNSINFDNSDSIIFLGTSSENEEPIKITKKVLSEPDRVFFDIENAITTFPNSTYELRNSRLTKVRIAQNSIDPNIVRIVIWNDEKYDASQIKILQIKNNIIIKLSNEIPLQQYLTQTYKESKASSVEYYDKAVIIPEEQKPAESDEIFNKVQQAFKEGEEELVRPNIEQKQARLKSRFFLEQVVPKNGNVLLSGIGVINIEKPFILTEPNRIVFDLPNTIVLQELRDKEISISETESVKIGQFEPSKARIVIKTNNPEYYMPIYSSNLQTLLLANKNNLSGVNISNSITELAFFKGENINPTTDVINIMFSQPIIYSIIREENQVNVFFYNLANFNTDSFNATAASNRTNLTAQRLGATKYKMTFPIYGTGANVDCYETLNASQLRFVFTRKAGIKPTTEAPRPNVKPEIHTTIPRPTVKAPTPVRKPEKKMEISKDSPLYELIGKHRDKIKSKKKKHTRDKSISRIRNRVIVIDPGHGGLDVGANRNKVYEKDLTLDIALKVRDELEERGFKNVLLTREVDKTLSLADRVAFSNSNKADIYVSIHINASVKSEIKGIETHYYTERGYKVAQVIHKELVENIDTEDRGLFKSKFYVINHTHAPAVLLEMGFISNEQERNSLASNRRQQDSAEAIADGIINYLMEH